MKWLNPRKDPLPLGDAFIAVINLRYEDYGLISAEEYNLKKYY